MLKGSYYLLLKPYLTDRYFFAKYNGELLTSYPIELPCSTGQCFGATVVLTVHHQSVWGSTHNNRCLRGWSHHSVKNMQNHLKQIRNWYTKSRIKINQTTSVQITFTTWPSICSRVTLNDTPVPIKTEAASELKSNVKKYIQDIQKQLYPKLGLMYSLWVESLH